MARSIEPVWYDSDPSTWKEAWKCRSTVPCGGCKYCTRAHNNWSRFTENVDDVVPLRMKETTEIRAALSWLFNTVQELAYQEPCAELHHTSLEISFANPDYTIDINMEEQQCNQVCTVGLQALNIPLRNWKFQKKDSDLGSILPYLVTNETSSEDEISISSKAAKKYWVNKEMNQSTRNFVRTCDVCSKHKKANRKAKWPRTKYQAGVPM